MRDTPRALLVRSGVVGTEAETLLCSELNVTAVGVDGVPADISSFKVAAVVTDRPYPSVAEAIDELCSAAHIPWCEATLVAHQYRIGPLIIPGRTPCYECWLRRVASQVQDPPLYQLLDLIGRRTVGAWFSGELPALNRQVAAVLAAELFALAAGAAAIDPSGMGRFWQGDAVYGGFELHRFSRIGRCRRCSKGNQSDLAALAEATQARDQQ
jgi:bacteriocin biosynthesis cyclodehydratase domain-containing protein